LYKNLLASGISFSPDKFFFPSFMPSEDDDSAILNSFFKVYNSTSQQRVAPYLTIEG
jgi:hypothetical protein